MTTREARMVNNKRLNNVRREDLTKHLTPRRRSQIDIAFSPLLPVKHPFTSLPRMCLLSCCDPTLSWRLCGHMNNSTTAPIITAV